MAGFPSTHITSALRRYHKRGVDILSLTPQSIARAARVKLKDIQHQMNEIEQYAKFLNENYA